MNIEIRKAGIRSGIFLTYEYNMDEAGTSAKIKCNSNAPIHDDLIATFLKLTPHFILLTEEMPVSAIESIIENNEPLPLDIHNKYKVTEFALGGTEDKKTITISGFKVLTNDRSVSFSTPSQLLYEEKSDGYKFDMYLREVLDEVIDEVQQYMDGKSAPRQDVGSFDFPDDDDQNEAFTMADNAMENFKENLQNSLPEGVTVEVSTGKSKKKIAEPIIEAGEE